MNIRYIFSLAILATTVYSCQAIVTSTGQQPEPSAGVGTTEEEAGTAQAGATDLMQYISQFTKALPAIAKEISALLDQGQSLATTVKQQALRLKTAKGEQLKGVVQDLLIAHTKALRNIATATQTAEDAKKVSPQTSIANVFEAITANARAAQQADQALKELPQTPSPAPVR